MRHLIDFKSGVVKSKQEYKVDVLRKNLSMLFCFLVFTNVSAANCLGLCNNLSDSLIEKINTWRQKGIAIAQTNFGIDKKR
jgi:hypothetical protein